MCDCYMELALNEAYAASKEGEVPVGVVIVENGEIISHKHNEKAKNKNIFCHAEMLAIEEAMNKKNDWRLIDCDMYVTLEPCPMCASAIKQSRIRNVYIGTRSKDIDNLNIINEIFCSKNNPKVNIFFLNDERCAKILTDFFLRKRKKCADVDMDRF